jgi:hypothetical protein
MWIGIVDVRVKISLASALPTVNGPERSVSRESVAAAKRKATAHASITPSDNFAGALCFAPQMAVSVEDGRQIRSGGLIIKTNCHQRHLEDELQASV